MSDLHIEGADLLEFPTTNHGNRLARPADFLQAFPCLSFCAFAGIIRGENSGSARRGALGEPFE